MNLEVGNQCNLHRGLVENEGIDRIPHRCNTLLEVL